ncbi:hypothetical protein ACOTDT_18885 [Achromobacter xylosoxidans]|uniref:hypothetical protein n=1 Tax=Alcaligenes xylosoxydans xylosoxydans TaxID=85698 RepID=UPI002A747FB1|nr:hypothetical protein [Achromobacter xylosoxidans]WPQ37732.1 hypothetical protein SLH34_13045 [Achromobacter xylosoxidans]
MKFLRGLRESKCKDRAVTIVAGTLKAVTRGGPALDPPPEQFARFLVATAWHSTSHLDTGQSPLPNPAALAALAVAIGLQGAEEDPDRGAYRVLLTCMSMISEILKAETLSPVDRALVTNAQDRLKRLTS